MDGKGKARGRDRPDRQLQLRERLARRLEHAKHLLANSDAKLSEIARLSGFGSADRMGRVFTRRLNTTPSDYRTQATSIQANGNTPLLPSSTPSPAALMATSQQSLPESANPKSTAQKSTNPKSRKSNRK